MEMKSRGVHVAATPKTTEVLMKLGIIPPLVAARQLYPQKHVTRRLIKSSRCSNKSTKTAEKPQNCAPPFKKNI